MKYRKLLLDFLLILSILTYLIFFKDVETNPEILLEQKLQQNIQIHCTSTIGNTHYMLFTSSNEHLGLVGYTVAFNGSPQFNEISYASQKFGLVLLEDNFIIYGKNPSNQIAYALITVSETTSHYIPIANTDYFISHINMPDSLKADPLKYLNTLRFYNSSNEDITSLMYN